MSEPLPSKTLKTIIEEFLNAKKAQDVISVDLAGKSSLADSMIIASGTSQRQVSSMAQLLREHLKKEGCPSVHIEGLPQGDWVLVDAGDVIVHLFRPEIRSFYNLEHMWGVHPPPSAT